MERLQPDAKLPAELEQIVRHVSDYDTQYTLQVEETDPSSPLFQLRMTRNRQAAGALYAWLQAERPDVFIVPNGTILEMGVAYQVRACLASRLSRLNLRTSANAFGSRRMARL